jgi:integrase
MARITRPLTDKLIGGSKPKDKKYKLSDGGGLFLLVSPGGSKSWRIKYRFNSKEKEYNIGMYPIFSLAEAREERTKIKKLIARDIDPNEFKNTSKKEAKALEQLKENTFYEISQKWLKSYESQVSESYHTRLGRALKNYLYPTLENTPIKEVTRLEVIAILDDLKNRDLLETAKRTAMLLNKIYKYAVTFEYVPHNIMSDIELKTVLGKREKKHYPTFTKNRDIRGLLLNIDDYTGDYSTKMALKILPYVFVRSYNIRHMEWEEIDFKAKEWIIPSEKMKTKTEFILPLPHQVIDILKELEVNALSGAYVFPSSIHKDRPLSDNTLISALRRMGYTKDEFVPHGFRAMFSTIAYEKANEEDGHGYTGEVIEALLAHKEPNKIKEAYNRSNYKKPMRGLLEWYADYLDEVKHGK